MSMVNPFDSASLSDNLALNLDLKSRCHKRSRKKKEKLPILTSSFPGFKQLLTGASPVMIPETLAGRISAPVPFSFLN